MFCIKKLTSLREQKCNTRRTSLSRFCFNEFAMQVSNLIFWGYICNIRKINLRMGWWIILILCIVSITRITGKWKMWPTWESNLRPSAHRVDALRFHTRNSFASHGGRGSNKTWRHQHASKAITHIEYTSLQRSHLVVFVQPRYIDQI